jgi:hypothetical protein
MDSEIGRVLRGFIFPYSCSGFLGPGIEGRFDSVRSL